jgi:pyruvate/2-oxoglutarate dehydrogenase complex dihydrolipoamide dehydrogenase (E3) component
VDERPAAGIWAFGEAAGNPVSTGVALDDYRVAKSVIVGGNRTTRSWRRPYAALIELELGRACLNGSEARQRGTAVRVATKSHCNPLDDCQPRVNVPITSR